MKSSQQHNFAKVPAVSHPRSSFNRSNSFKTSFNSGELIPVFSDEVLPGDSFNLKMHAFARLSTPIFPIMDNMFLNSFFFFVPMRLLWDNWQRFMGEQKNPEDSIDFLFPSMLAPTGTGWELHSIADYLGMPVFVQELEHTCMYHRAYNLIYNEFFRDQNLQESVPVPLDDGPDKASDYPILRRGKRRDYFTSCLPFTQKGPSVNIPLGDKAPVVGIGRQPGGIMSTSTNTNVFDTAHSPAFVTYAQSQLVSSTATGNKWQIETVGTNATNTYPRIFADLTEASAATVNDLRQAFQVQRFLERDARGGTRYTELIHSHFGVTSPDARLQRPEYLGGGQAPIRIHPIAQTSATLSSVVPNSTPQGNLSAIATISVNGTGFTKSFVEHGIILGLISARANLTYQQGLERRFSRKTRFEFYFPVFSNLGEQAVLNKEIYAVGADSDNDVFGYQERYAEYRYKPSIITGLFRSSAPESLDPWHLAQEFNTLPVLGPDFIVDNPPVERVVSVPSEPDFIADVFYDLKCARPMPVYSIPGKIDQL